MFDCTQFLDEKHGIKVHFSSNQNTYYSAYKYTTKEDKDFALSDSHPDLENSSPPRTERAISEKRSKGKARQKGNGGSRKGRKRGLSVYDVAELIQQKKIKCRLELMSLLTLIVRRSNPPTFSSFSTVKLGSSSLIFNRFLCNRRFIRSEIFLGLPLFLLVAKRLLSAPKNSLQMRSAEEVDIPHFWPIFG